MFASVFHAQDDEHNVFSVFTFIFVCVFARCAYNRFLHVPFGYRSSEVPHPLTGRHKNHTGAKASTSRARISRSRSFALCSALKVRATCTLYVFEFTGSRTQYTQTHTHNRLTKYQFPHLQSMPSSHLDTPTPPFLDSSLMRNPQWPNVVYMLYAFADFPRSTKISSLMGFACVCKLQRERLRNNSE